MAKVAIIGECMVEVSGPPFSNQLTQNYGGDTLNTAVYLSRLLPTENIHYVTALGKDAISDAMCESWQKEGVTTDHVLRFDSLFPGLYWIILDEKGERSFLYWRKQSAASQWLKHPDIEKTLDQLMNMDWIYLSGITLAILDMEDRAKLIDWLTKYKAQGGKVAFDSNYRPLLWGDRQIAADIHQQILSMTDLALLTDDDEATIWNLQGDGLIQHLKGFNVPVLILKQGKNGALVITPNQQDYVVPSLVVDKVVDSTAAGDSFNAGFLAAYIQNHSLADSCQAGHKLASTVIQHKGAIIPAVAMP